MILKPGKRQGVALIKKSDCKQSTGRLFSDQRQFKVLNKDPTIRSLRTVQIYLNTLYNRGEITELEKKEMCRKFAQIARAHCLPKSHKSYGTIPSFRPIVDTTNTPYYGISKYLSSLLNPLTDNSLFKNVPLNRTIKIIFRRIYEKKFLAKKLRKSTLKRLIKDKCMKTVI